MTGHKRKMSNLLLNARFQLKYTGMLVGLSSLLCVALGAFLHEQMRVNSRMLQLDPEFDAAFQAQLAQSDTQTTMVMVGAFVLFNLLLVLLGVLVTHKMAGPVFVIRRYLEQLASGKIPTIRKLRKGDEFVELVEALEKTAESIEAQTKEDIELLEALQQRLENAQEVETLRTELQGRIDAKHAMLRRA